MINRLFDHDNIINDIPKNQKSFGAVDKES